MNTVSNVRIILLAGMSVIAVNSSAQKQAKPYFTHDELPNSVAYIPAPPDTTDAAFFNDWLVYSRGLELRPTPRGAQAKADADYTSEYLAAYFSPAMGYEISEEKSPATYHLLRCVAWTGGDATWKAKNHYMRRRPFMVFNQHTLTPDDEPGLSRNGSYPSGHTSMGWATALVLAEVNPDAQDSILTLGYEYGQSRTIVGAHFQSDVDAGRVTGSAAVARMHTSPEFQADVAAAKAECARLLHKIKGPDLNSPANARKRRL